MALIDYQVFTHNLMKVGLVKAGSSEDALGRAKRMYPYCIAPIVQSVASLEEAEKVRLRYWGGLRRYEQLN